MVLDKNFWKNKRVFITGHTGFKGGWLSLWLNSLGCELCGYSLAPYTDPNLFTVFGLEDKMEHNIGDIRDAENLSQKFINFKPDIVLHLAAQPLVRYSYDFPKETYETNVIGTLNVLEAVRKYGKCQATVVVTSDKCYENREQHQGYKETDPMGGFDPYSSSKGCTELLTASYARSYFINGEIGKIASVRAGNVIGGGDWSTDRLIPDLVKALQQGKNPVIRNPKATRPWQHVIEPIYGYLLVAQMLCGSDKQSDLLSWNFGPNIDGQLDVGSVANKVCEFWGNNSKVELNIDKNAVHEANLLYLNCDKAKKDLKWNPKWNIDDTLKNTISWYKNFYDKNSDIVSYSLNQIAEYVE